MPPHIPPLSSWFSPSPDFSHIPPSSSKSYHVSTSSSPPSLPPVPTLQIPSLPRGSPSSPSPSPPMRVEAFSQLLTSLCDATGMSPTMLYNCLGATLGAPGALPLPHQGPGGGEREGREREGGGGEGRGGVSGVNFQSKGRVGGESSDAQSGFARQSTQDLLGGGRGRGEGEGGEESVVPNESSTQVSGTSSVRLASSSPSEFGGGGGRVEKVGGGGGLERAGVVVVGGGGDSYGQVSHVRSSYTESPSSEGPWVRGGGGGEEDLLGGTESRSVVSHVSGGSNMWSPSLSPMISPLLVGLSPPFSSLSPLERGESLGGLLPTMERASSFSLAEIFAEMGGETAGPSSSLPSLYPLCPVSLGSLAAANGHSSPSSSRPDPPPGAGVIGSLHPPLALLGKRKCSKTLPSLSDGSDWNYGPQSQSQPHHDGQTQSQSQSHHIHQDGALTLGPLGSLLRLGSEAASHLYAKSQPLVPPSLPLPPPPPTPQTQTLFARGGGEQRGDGRGEGGDGGERDQGDPGDGGGGGRGGFQGASWQSSVGSPELGAIMGDSWHLQLEDVSSPSGGPLMPLSHASEMGINSSNQAKVSVQERGVMNPGVGGGLVGGGGGGGGGPAPKRVRKSSKNKTNISVESSAGSEMGSEVRATGGGGGGGGGGSPRQTALKKSPNMISSSSFLGAPPLSCPVGQGQRPEMKAILRKAPSQAMAASEGKKTKKKSPEEVLREAFQASMAARAAKDPHTVLGIKRGPCNEPQALAARARRERVNVRMRVLQQLVPGAAALTTECFLLEARHYVTFLLRQAAELSERPADAEPLPRAEALSPVACGEKKDGVQFLGTPLKGEGEGWGWPRDSELLRRGLRVVAIPSVLGFAGEGGQLDKLLVGLGGQGGTEEKAEEEEGEEYDAYDLDDF